MKRIFIALKVEAGDTLIRSISSLRSLLMNERINWVDPANIHLTLAFLGDMEDERIKAVDIAVREKCRRFGSFSFRIAGTGLFRNFRDPRVIWAGIEECEQIISLNRQILKGLNDAGIEIKEQPFRPHITLGRIKYLKDIKLLESALDPYRYIDFQEVFISEVILFESILKPSGPLYRSLGKFSLI